MISIEVLGEPAPKGSMRAMLIKGRPIVVASGSRANEKALKAWTKAIAAAVVSSIGERTEPLYVEQPLEVHLMFKLLRPAGHYSTGKVRSVKASAPLYPMVMCDDIDKLARSTLDALTGLLFDDDGRIVTLVCTKHYADSAAQQGVVITIDSLLTSKQYALSLDASARKQTDKTGESSPIVPKC